ncbi:Glucan 4-alpha-glucosidase [Apiospora aurea]|uniref:Glucan 4-alpha-glucosidase n=1 Tax=Apiospora aurea TaxID=335848 RepID=A0ABR1PYP9_9PEZI
MSGSKNNDNNKASDLDRSGSVRTSVRVSTSSALDDDDDYDLEAAGISDGFRPTEISQNHYANPQPPSSHLGPAPTSSPPPRPSSITKPHRQHDSLTLRHDGATGPTHAPSPALMRTSSASTSTSGAVRPESPYEGPSGPSFPYQMYPQNVRLQRTASVTTASTAAVSEVSSYHGPRGPTHPYQMYPQNTVPGVETTEDRITPAPIPVGFPGAADQYQRRIGPDGEEIADMIGPDGHTEQLPPYTRYPEEAYLRKAVALESTTPAPAPVSVTSTPQPQPQPQSPRHAPSSSIPGAGGLGLATRNPEFASTEDLHTNGANSPLSRQSMRSFQTDVSHHDINTAAMSITNEKEKLNDWQKAAKRKVWGVVPCWAIALTAIVLVMLAIVLGAILGTFFGGKHQRPPPSPPASSDTTPSVTLDLVPWPTFPSGLAPLATGDYTLPLSLDRSPSTCFNDTTQAQAWNCNIIFSQLTLTIKALDDEPATSQYAASLSYNSSLTLANSVFTYGMQPPSIQDVQLILVNDTNEPGRGPAWAFELPYNKTVIIPEELFPTTTASISAAMPTSESTDSPRFKRGRKAADFSDQFKRKGVAHPGDKPWICHWGGTLLETFIYASQNSSRNPIVTGSSSSSAPIQTPSASYTGPYAGPGENLIMPGYPPTAYAGGDERMLTPSPIVSTTTVTPTSTPTNPFQATTPTSNKSSYPRVVKLEERRVADGRGRTPFCRQYNILANGQGAEPVKDKEGNYVEVSIIEDERTSSSGSNSNSNPSRRIRRRDIEKYLGHSIEARDVGKDMSNCGCMWWLT